MTNFIFLKTPQNLPVPAYRFENNGPEVLILGGVHGDEIEGIVAAHGLLEAFLKNFPYKLNLTLVPSFNLDGVLAKTRCNSHGVDLNRNLPTKDWSSEIKNVRYHPGPFANSEPENQALVQFLQNKKPKFIISLHSWFPVLNPNGDCLPEAQSLSQWTGYKIEEDIGYPTPGSLGTYGKENSLPVLTYEIEQGLNPKEILKIHVPAILEALKITEIRYAQTKN